MQKPALTNKTKSEFLIILFCFLIFIVPFFQTVFGHGMGGETLSPITVGDRNATIYLTMQPEVFDPNAEEQNIQVRFFDADTGGVIEHVTYLIELSKGDQRIFRYMFHDDYGNLFLKIKPTDSENITIHGKNEPVLGGWMRIDDYNPVTLEGPIFISGGLYNFNIEILTVDSDTKVLEERPTYKGAISVAERTSHDVTGADGNQYEVITTSYYDQIQNFDYNSQERLIYFSMPFDWSEQNIKQVYILHEELHIPKNMPDLLATKYDVTLNGVIIPEKVVIIDDYSEDNRTVHLILRSEEILAIREAAIKTSQDKMDFSFKPSVTQEPVLSAATPGLLYDVTLSWNPNVIESEQNIRFYIDIGENFVPSKEVYPVPFDFVLTQDDKEIFRKKIVAQVNAEPKTNFIDYTFTSSHEGSIKVNIENIDDKFLSSVSFVTVVESKQKLNTFPITLTSMLLDDSGNKIEGNYNVDLTWFSDPLTIDESSEFVITIYDKNTGIQVFQSEYDFVLLQNNEEIYRKSGFASAGGSFENFVFKKDNLGEVTLRLENIDKSSEYVEIPIVVTPEFPLTALLVLPLSLIVIILFSKFSKHNKV